MDPDLGGGREGKRGKNVKLKQKLRHQNHTTKIDRQNIFTFFAIEQVLQLSFTRFLLTSRDFG
jgi:hypothetical protein